MGRHVSSYDPDADGNLEVALDCGVCIIRVPKAKVSSGDFSTKCSKRHNLRKENP